MILDQFRLTGKVAIVTGGTSGIGYAIATAFAEAGAIVVPTSRTPEKVRATTQEIQRLGAQTLEMAVDVNDPDMVENLAEAVLQKFGKIDILVNNAGTTVKKPVLEQSVEDWHKVINLNLTSVYHCCKSIGTHMIRQNDGRIINIASLASRFGLINSVPYCTSKGGLLQLTRALSAEWAQYNIRVNAIAPGYFMTPMTRGILQNKELYERIINRTPMRRLGNVEELRGAAVFLASDASSYVTGEILYVDGGFSAYGV